MFDEEGPDPFDQMLKQQLIKMIMWAENESPRSKQERIGPSEIGSPCDRRIAYKMAGVPAVNTAHDPWPAVVGTAVHSWLEKAVNNFQAGHGIAEWTTEQTVLIDDIEGHSDLYWNRNVIDWKTAGPNVMKKVKAHGPPDGYVIQAQTYGLGFANMGWPVDRVVLVFLPRCGWLRDMYVWSAPYDEGLAQAAVARPYEIAQEILDLDTFTYPHRWNQIAAAPGDHCGHCPWFNAIGTKEQGASDKGCPAA